MNNLINEREMARCLGCCERSVRRLRERGIIPVIRVGNLVRYSADDVLQALARASAQEGADKASPGADGSIPSPGVAR